MIDHHGYGWRYLRLLITVVAVLSMGTAAAVSGASAANAKCKPNRPNDGKAYWDGWERTPNSTVGGVYSDIYNYSPWVRDTVGVTAWVMLNNGSDHWAQTGWLESTGGVRYTFVQWTDSGGTAHEKWFSAQPVGSFSYYTTLWNNPSGKFSFQVNSRTIDTESAAFTPNEAEIFGEIPSLWNQMPGATQNHENFDDSHIYLSGWQNFSGTNYDTGGSNFGNSHVSSTQTDIWDNACQT